MKCSECQADIDANSLFCPKCGERIDTVDETQDGPSTETKADEPKTMSARIKDIAKSADPNEENLPAAGWSEGGYSGKAMRLTFIFAATVSLVLVGATAWIGANVGLPDLMIKILWWAVAIAVSAYWLYLFGIYIYRTWTIKYRLTTFRFYHEEGIFRRVKDVIEVIDMDDIKMEQTLWDRLINGGVGSIIIHSADSSNPELILHGLENPEVVFQAIDETRRKQRVERGLKSI